MHGGVCYVWGGGGHVAELCGGVHKTTALPLFLHLP